MTAPSNAYRRLSGTGYRRLVPAWAMVLLFFVMGIFALLLRGRRVQLWLGDGHLLLVEWDGYREYYKRFAYADIQTISLRRTSEGRNMSIALGTITVALAALALASPEIGWRIFCLVLVGLFVLVLIVNLALGPTCQCHLRTAVQVEELPSLSRLRNARRVLDQLRPLVQQAQGGFSADEVAARIQGAGNPLETSAVESVDRPPGIQV